MLIWYAPATSSSASPAKAGAQLGDDDGARCAPLPGPPPLDPGLRRGRQWSATEVTDNTTTGALSHLKVLDLSRQVEDLEVREGACRCVVGNLGRTPLPSPAEAGVQWGRP